MTSSKVIVSTALLLLLFSDVCSTISTLSTYIPPDGMSSSPVGPTGSTPPVEMSSNPIGPTGSSPPVGMSSSPTGPTGSTPPGSVCTVRGDPHIKTFDRRRYTYGGTCPHYLLNGLSQPIPFAIIGDFIPCRRQTVSCLQSVIIEIGGHTFVLGHELKVYVDGSSDAMSVPFSSQDIDIYETLTSNYLIAYLSNEVVVYWDGRRKAIIDVSGGFHNNTFGMCGTFNGDRSDDFMKADLTVASDVVDFGNSWKINDPACQAVAHTTPLAEESTTTLT